MYGNFAANCRYCGAANGLMTEVLEGHLRHHLSNAELSHVERDQDLEAVLQVLRSYLK